MTAKEFNKKYKDYLVEGYYGLDIHNDKVIRYLDEKFQEFIKIPNFKYFQIKLKFGSSRFYTERLSKEIVSQTEQIIDSIIKNEIREIK